MKLLNFLCFILILMLACKSISEEERTAKNFLQCLSRGEYEKARNYVIPASLAILYDFENIGVSTDTLKAHPIAWRIDSLVKLPHDTVQVYYLWNGFPEQMQLVKIKGRWKVIF